MLDSSEAHTVRRIYGIKPRNICDELLFWNACDRCHIVVDPYSVKYDSYLQ